MQKTRKTARRSCVFIVFRSSLASEMLFLTIFDEKTRATSCFSRFLHFVHERRMIFSFFLLSSVDDERFSMFFAFRRPTTSIFSQFLHFVDRRRIFFAVLYKFPVGEMQKILKTARREKNRTPKVISSNFRGSVHILIRTCSFIIL